MAVFCGKCGSLLMDQAMFCGSCGSPALTGAQPASRPAAPTVAPGGFTPVNVSPVPLSTTPAAKSSNALLRIAIVLIAIIFVGGIAALAAVYYAAHKVSEKIHSVSQQVLGGANQDGAGSLSSLLNSSSGTRSQESGDALGPKGDLCRFLTREDVRTYTGATVIRVDSSPEGCVYVAHGDPADALTKHLGGMLAQQGADPKAQQMAQKFAGAFFQQQEQSDKDLSVQAKTGELPILTINFSSGDAVSEMKLNRTLMARLGAEDLTGIGDEAFNSSDGIMTVRKGNTMFRITYISCPCNINAIKPLAQKLANAL